MSLNNVIKKINSAHKAKKPFLFGFNYELTDAFFVDNPLNQSEILWRVGDVTNYNGKVEDFNNRSFIYHPITLNDYKKKFDYVMSQLQQGNSFLANLTIKTPITTNYSFEEIFARSNSRYALMIPGRLVCFSPETFVKIINNRIYSYPMKGTISGEVEGAEIIILNDYKESAEHYTIVDFIRSDLSRVSHNIRVDRLRYIQRLATSKGAILQVSSEVSGTLPDDYELGDLLLKILPAGSISGAPKPSTLSILAEAEGEPRGYYTGIFGYYDGFQLNTAVMIRYIENDNDQLYFRSGGGITINSNLESEYNEVLEKIYLPFL